MTAHPSAVPTPESSPDAGAAWHYGDPLGEQRAATDGAVVIDRSHRAVLTLTGNDRQTWLHSLSSQHVSALPDGAVTENLSLDLQGRVEDHWVQTELGGTTYLDTEPWRGEPLLTYLRTMVFWADVQVEPADLAVLSLLGPGAAERPVVEALDVEELPQESTAVALPGGGFLRRLPAPGLELDLVVPRGSVADHTRRLIDAGVRPAGMWAYEAHRVAAGRPRLGVDTDERTIPHEVGWIGGPGLGAVHLDKGCYRGQETVARVHNLGKPPRMLVILHLDGAGELPVTGDVVTAGGRTVGRIGTVVEHADEGPIALALVKRAVAVDTALVAGEQAQAPAVIDPDSMPVADTGAGAGRAAVERLRGGRS